MADAPVVAEPAALGTLVVVVGKARNLPDKSRFGKQDPFCTVTIGEEKKKTRAIKRGGQHPEWDEELRFTVVEDIDDLLVRSDSKSNGSLSSSTSKSSLSKDDPAVPGVVTPATLASKSRKGPIGKKGVKAMKVSCYADDPKEPELIGEVTIPIDDVLKKGEVDEWYEFSYKEKYSGEVYLELTFYSNAIPPVKRNVPRPPVLSSHIPGGLHPTPSISSVSSMSTMSSVSSISSVGSSATIRPSSSMGMTGSVSGMNLYIPPYGQQQAPARQPSPSPSQMAPSSSFADLGLPPTHSRTHSLNHAIQIPGQPEYPPSSSMSHLPPAGSTSALDALLRPMSSMSLSPSPSSQHLASPTSPNHSHHAHRHSVGGSEAPWAPLMPQTHRQSLPSHPRPVSASDAVPWDQAARQEDERRAQAMTPVPMRPVSSQSHIQSPSQPYYPPSTATPIPQDYRAPSPLAPGQYPPQHPARTEYPPPLTHSQSASMLQLPGQGYSQLPAQTPPPPPPQTAPPSTDSHYQVPSSSFAGIAQQVMDPMRSSTPRPYPHQHQQQPSITQAPPPKGHDYHAPYDPAHGSYQAQHAPPHQPPYPQTQASHDPYGPPSRRESLTSAGGYAPPGDYRPVTPSASTLHVTSPTSFVPQSSFPTPGASAHPQQGYGQPPYTAGPPVNSTYVPPAPSATPMSPPVNQQHQPWPPATPQPSQTPAPGPPPTTSTGTYVPWHQQTQAPPTQAQTGPSYGQYDVQPQPPPLQTHSSTSSISSESQYRPVPNPPPPPRLAGMGYYPSDELYVQQQQQQPPQHPPQHPPPSTPTPAPQSNWHQAQAYNQPPQQPYNAHQPQYPPHQPPTPGPQTIPPSQTYYAPPPSHTPAPAVPPRATTPTPSTYAAGPNLASPAWGQHQHTTSTASQYARAPSPGPGTQYGGPQSPGPQGQYNAAPDGWHSTVQQGNGIPPSLPPRAPSPMPPVSAPTQTTNTDWRAWMQNLGTGSSATNGTSYPTQPPPPPVRAPSPQPPPKDSMPQQQQQQQGAWYTPPPNLPASIRPPDGWNSTLPAKTGTHEWRG